MGFPEVENEPRAFSGHYKMTRPDRPYQREVSCFFIPGHDVLSITTNNSAGGVAFDFFTIWEKLKTIDTLAVCMLHSHPPGCTTMSNTDANMVYGWCQAIKQPILFMIVTRDEDSGLTLTTYHCEKSQENRNKVSRARIDIEINEKVRELMDFIWYLSTYPKKVECDVDGKTDFSDALRGEFKDTIIGFYV